LTTEPWLSSHFTMAVRQRLDIVTNRAKHAMLAR